jgi:hypothetical protein
VADPGTMAFELDNSASNSAATRGYYSPDHASVRAGFSTGIPVRLVLNHDLFGDKVVWWGTISKLAPKAGARAQSVSVECVDWMEEAQRAKLEGIDVQTDVQSDALFATLVAAVEKAPPGGVLSGSGSDVYEFALDNEQDESSKVHGAFDKLARSEVGLVYVAAGVATFEGRRRRGGAGNVKFALDEDGQITAFGVSYSRDDVINRVQVSIHPRRHDETAVVLFTLGSSIEIPRKTSVVINCPYRDPNQQAQRVGAIISEMIAPVATTDYSFNSTKAGDGVDLTGQLTVEAVFGGNSASVTLTNEGPADGFVPAGGLQLRGQGLYDFEPVFADRRDAASEVLYGDNVYAYDMPYQNNPNNASDLALFLLSLNKDQRARVDSVSYLANWSDEEAEQAFTLAISDKISVTSASLGLVARPFFINGIRLDVRMNGVVVVTYDTAPVDDSQFWQLEVDGRTELDETTVLGYGLFATGWLLDTSALGTETFLN